MLNLGIPEIIVVVVLAIVVVGPERLPGLLRALGRQYGKLMAMSSELRRAFMMEAERAEAEARLEQLRRRRAERAGGRPWAPPTEPPVAPRPEMEPPKPARGPLVPGLDLRGGGAADAAPGEAPTGGDAAPAGAARPEAPPPDVAALEADPPLPDDGGPEERR